MREVQHIRQLLQAAESGHKEDLMALFEALPAFLDAVEQRETASELLDATPFMDSLALRPDVQAETLRRRFAQARDFRKTWAAQPLKIREEAARLMNEQLIEIDRMAARQLLEETLYNLFDEDADDA